MDLQSVYRKMKKVLVRAQCKDICFHDLRHTFATTALEHGMDAKTLFVCVSSEKRKTKPLNDYVTINTTLKQFSLEYDWGIELDNWLLFAIIYTLFRHHNGR